MMLRTGLIVDANNLYFSIQSAFGNRLIRFEEYVKHLEALGHTLTYKVIYSKQKVDVAKNFIIALENQGFEIHFGNTKWDIPMTLRAADMVPNIDCLILGSNNLDAGKILYWAKERGKLVKCFAHNIHPALRQIGECIEITENLLSPPKEPKIAKESSPE